MARAPSPANDYSPLAEVAPSTSSPANYLTQRATPEAFGAGVDQAVQGLGHTVEKVGEEGAAVAIKAQTMATEAATNDLIANQWAPTVAKLSGAYRLKQGKDAVDGYQPFIDSLNAARAQTLEKATSPLQKQLLGSFMSRHVTQEVESAKRWQDSQLTAYEDHANQSAVDAQQQYALGNYTDANALATARSTADALLLKHGLDRGLPMEAIRQQQRDTWGKTAAQIVHLAMARDDPAFAQKFYDEHKDNIPGLFRIQIEDKLHQENTRQQAVTFVDAVTGGVQPQRVIGPPEQGEALSAVVKVAQASGVDPSVAATVSRIESNHGQNLGKRGDIGQTGKGGTTWEEQAKHMVDAWKIADNAATMTLGRRAEPWEAYAVYQQGVGGGPALMRADPNANAIEVLRPLYRSEADARSAILNNGGTPSTTAGQFLDQIRTMYGQRAQQSQVDVAAFDAPPPPPAPPIQQAPSARGARQQFDAAYPAALEAIKKLGVISQRDAALHELERRRTLYTHAALAEDRAENENKKTVVDWAIPQIMAGEIKGDLLPALQAKFGKNIPGDTLQHLYGFWKTWTNEQIGIKQTAAAQQTANNENDAMLRVMNGEYKDPNQILALATPIDAYDAEGNRIGEAQPAKISARFAQSLLGMMSREDERMFPGTTETMKALTAAAKHAIGGTNPLTGMKDPKGDELYLRWWSQFNQRYNDARQKGVPPRELLDPESKTYLGDYAKYTRSFADQQQDWRLANGAGTPKPASGVAPQVPVADGETALLPDGSRVRWNEVAGKWLPVP